MSAIGESIRRRHGGRRRPPQGPRPPLRWGRIALYGVLGALAAFGIGYALAVLALFPAPAAAAPGIAVPRLVGQDTFFARDALADRGLRLGNITQLPDPAAAVGTVVAQDALAGQQLRRGATVNLAVSSGPARAVLPNVAGYAAPRAAALLTALGFQVTQQLAPDATPAGRVVRLAPAPGIEYDLPAGILLTVSSGPPPPADTTAPTDSTAADSARTITPATGAAPAGAASAGAAPAPARPAPGAPPAPAGGPAPRSAPRDTTRHGAGAGVPGHGAGLVPGR